MRARQEASPRTLSRRTVVKGLLGVSITAGGAGCTPFSSSPAPTPTAGARHVVPAPTTQTPVARYTYYGHTGAVNALLWLGDGKHIASGSADGTVQVWEATTGTPLFTYRGHVTASPTHPGKVFAVARSPEGRRVASGGLDHSVQVWQPAEGARMAMRQRKHPER
jgi:hypothetical protein